MRRNAFISLARRLSSLRLCTRDGAPILEASSSPSMARLRQALAGTIWDSAEIRLGMSFPLLFQGGAMKLCHEPRCGKLKIQQCRLSQHFHAGRASCKFRSVPAAFPEAQQWGIVRLRCGVSPPTVLKICSLNGCDEQSTGKRMRGTEHLAPYAPERSAQQCTG